MPVVLAFHGYAMKAPDLLSVLEQAIPPSFLLISVQGPMTALAPGAELGKSRETGYHWGVSPRAEENRDIHRAAVEMGIKWSVEQGGDRSRVSLIAFSQPCSFNYRLALNPPEDISFRALVALCGGIPGEWKDPGLPSASSSRTHVLHISASADPFYPQEVIASYPERLTGRFASVQHIIQKGGHRIPSAAFPVISEFLERYG